MNWLFWMLLTMILIFMIQGFRKGLIRTAVSMFSIVIVAAATMWLNPYIGSMIRENTDWQEKLEQKCSVLLVEEMEERLEISDASQNSFIEEMPLPEIVREKLVENNNSETYQSLAVESFAGYLSKYIAAGIMNGITFLLSFVSVWILMKILLCAVDRITDLPVIGGLNRIGGMLLGTAQGVIWLWVIFLIITLFCNTGTGRYLMGMIRENPVLLWIYDRNCLVQILMEILL